MKLAKKIILNIIVFTLLAMPASANAMSVIKGENKTKIKNHVYPKGGYQNWDGVSTVSQFTDKDGNFCFAYKSKNKVVIVTTEDSVVKNKIKLEMKGKLLGGVAADDENNYYVVTGTPNESAYTLQDTVFISKYDSNGNFIGTVGDNGSSSLQSYYGGEFNTKIPFDAGNCDIAINGDMLAVNYAREMYSDHQSNSVFAINHRNMEKIYLPGIYSSHSFGQRSIPFKDGFLFASEGDAYNRAFTISRTGGNRVLYEKDIFHFWVENGTFTKWDMYTLNDNFAHIGDLVNIDNAKAAFVATSAKAMSQDAKNQEEQLFIQIFDPDMNLESESAYITSGMRSGITGKNGDEFATNYGIKWLTEKDWNITNPQAVYDGKGHIIVLFEQSRQVYYMILDTQGNIIKGKSRYLKKATLNACETPVVSKGTVYWASNRKYDYKNRVYIYSLKVDK